MNASKKWNQLVPLIVVGWLVISGPLVRAEPDPEPVIGGKDGSGGGADQLKPEEKRGLAVYNNSCTMSVQVPEGNGLKAIGFIAAHCLKGGGSGGQGGGDGGQGGGNGGQGGRDGGQGGGNGGQGGRDGGQGGRNGGQGGGAPWRGGGHNPGLAPEGSGGRIPESHTPDPLKPYPEEPKPEEPKPEDEKPGDWGAERDPKLPTAFVSQGGNKQPIKFADGRSGTAECKGDPSFKMDAKHMEGNDFAVCEVTMGNGGEGGDKKDATSDKPGSQPFCIAKEVPKKGEKLRVLGCAQQGSIPKTEKCQSGELKVTHTQGSNGGKDLTAASDESESAEGMEGAADTGTKAIHTVGQNHLQKGDSGGPLLNQKGEIVGVNSTSEIKPGGGNTHGIVDISFVKKFADERGLKVCIAKGSSGGNAHNPSIGSANANPGSNTH